MQAMNHQARNAAPPADFHKRLGAKAGKKGNKRRHHAAYDTMLYYVAKAAKAKQGKPHLNCYTSWCHSVRLYTIIVYYCRSRTRYVTVCINLYIMN